MGISDEEVAAAVYRRASRIAQFGTGGGSAVSVVARCARARHGADDTICIHLANALVGGISDVKVAAAVYRHAERTVQLGTGGGSVVLTKEVARCARARHGADLAVAYRHLTNAIVGGISDVEVAILVYRHASRRVQFGTGG